MKKDNFSLDGTRSVSLYYTDWEDTAVLVCWTPSEFKINGAIYLHNNSSDNEELYTDILEGWKKDMKSAYGFTGACILKKFEYELFHLHEREPDTESRKELLLFIRTLLRMTGGLFAPHTKTEVPFVDYETVSTLLEADYKEHAYIRIPYTLTTGFHRELAFSGDYIEYGRAKHKLEGSSDVAYYCNELMLNVMSNKNIYTINKIKVSVVRANMEDYLVQCDSEPSPEECVKAFLIIASILGEDSYLFQEQAPCLLRTRGAYEDVLDLKRANGNDLLCCYVVESRSVLSMRSVLEEPLFENRLANYAVLQGTSLGGLRESTKVLQLTTDYKAAVNRLSREVALVTLKKSEGEGAVYKLFVVDGREQCTLYVRSFTQTEVVREDSLLVEVKTSLRENGDTIIALSDMGFGSASILDKED